MNNLNEDFYLREDISYTSPGSSRNDYVTVWLGTQKQKLRKHFLLMYVEEAWALFKVENPGIKISLSYFAELRPTNALLVKDTPKEQCKYTTHENFVLKLKARQHI